MNLHNTFERIRLLQRVTKTKKDGSPVMCGAREFGASYYWGKISSNTQRVERKSSKSLGSCTYKADYYCLSNTPKNPDEKKVVGARCTFHAHEWVSYNPEEQALDMQYYSPPHLCWISDPVNGLYYHQHD